MRTCAIIKQSTIKKTHKMINEQWFESNTFQAHKKPTKEHFYIAESDGVLETLEGPVNYQKGSYIMTGPKGEQYPISPSKFYDLKEINEDGTASPKQIVKTVKIADHDGVLETPWGHILNYVAGIDVIVRHDENDYSVIKKDIFDQTYESI